MLNSKGVSIFWYTTEAGYERICKAIGDLKAHAKQHRKDEEYSHTLLLEQSKCLETKCFGDALFLVTAANRTCRQRESIKEQQDAYDARSGKLIFVGLEAHEVDKPHGADEAHCAKHTDGREILHGV